MTAPYTETFSEKSCVLGAIRSQADVSVHLFGIWKEEQTNDPKTTPAEELWYHGTTPGAARNILKVGFKHPHNWFASTIQAAENVGGSVILGVYLAVNQAFREPADRWQVCIHKTIAPTQIKLVKGKLRT